jgi:hypothetical protein
MDPSLGVIGVCQLLDPTRRSRREKPLRHGKNFAFHVFDVPKGLQDARKGNHSGGSKSFPDRA